MASRHYLRRRILAGFVLFGLTVVGFSIGTFVKAYYDGQDSLTEALVSAEVERVRAHYRETGATESRRQAPLFTYTRVEDMSSLHAKLAAHLPPGLHEMDTGTGPAVDRDMTIWVGKLGTKPLWVVFDMPDVETIPRIARDYLQLALAYGAAILIFGGWLASTISRRISEPLERFAGEIDAQSPGEWRGDFADRYGVGEIGSVASALDTAIHRNRDLLERERIFMQNASHELRTPLTVITGAAEVLESMPVARDSRSLRLVQRIGRAARDMKTLTESFLWLGREPDPAPEKEICHAEEVVKRAIRQTLHLLESKPVEVGIDADRPLAVACRPELLEIALVNLIRNAFQHVDAGRVDVRIGPDSIEVADTGPGLPPGEAGKLTRRGERGMDSEGFGLGLAIVQQLCDRLNWKFTLVNRPSGGCRARLEGLAT